MESLNNGGRMEDYIITTKIEVVKYLALKELHNAFN